MPVYNTAAYLRRCLDSIVGQTMCDWECIAVDDGSTDGSSEILQEYSAKEPRIKVFTQANAGPVTARMRAVQEAQGEFLLFVDSDDTIDSELLAATTGLAEAEALDMVWFKVATEVGGKRVAVMNEPFSTSPSEMLTLLLQYRLQGWLWSKLVRRSFWLGAEIEVNPDCWVMEDTVITLQLLAANPRVGKADIVGYNYNRSNAASLTGTSRSHDIIARSLPNLELIGRLLREKGLFEARRADFASMVLPAKVYLVRVGRIREARRLEHWMNRRPAYFASIGRKKWPYWLLMNGGLLADYILIFRNKKIEK